VLIYISMYVHFFTPLTATKKAMYLTLLVVKIILEKK